MIYDKLLFLNLHDRLKYFSNRKEKKKIVLIVSKKKNNINTYNSACSSHTGLAVFCFIDVEYFSLPKPITQ